MSMQDGSSGVALWRQVADGIERGIAGGIFAAGEKLPGDIFSRRRHFVKLGIVLIQKFVIKAIVHDFPRASLDFADVDEHSRDRIDLAAKNKIGGIIATGPVLCPCLLAKRGQVFAVGPAGKEQPPRG